MHSRYRAQVYSIFIFFITTLSIELSAQNLRVSTFNIRWYGLESSSNNDYYRDQKLRDTLDSELERSDVIMFQEIVDVSRFKKYLIRGKMKCMTYHHESEKHQHVVMCYKNKYTFGRTEGDNNYTIEKVTEQTKKGRPALYGVLKASGGRRLAYIVGVHLKAFPDETAIRLSQVHAISKRLKQLDSDIPIIITGDFNTHYAYNTDWYKDDYRLMNDIFRDYNLNLKEVYNPYDYTYASKKEQNKFDRFWVSRSVSVKSAVRSSKLCSYSVSTSPKQIEWYNKNVSDHCLVSVTLDIN